MRQLSYIFIFALCICISALQVFYKDFSHFKVGPLYPLDWLFIFWFLTMGVFEVKNLKSLFKNLWPFILFAAYGLLRLAFEFTIPDQKTLQHCILFLYPLMWVLVGFTIFKNYVFQKVITLVTLISGSILFFTADLPINVSLGPVIAIPAVYFFTKLFTGIKKIYVLPVLILVFVMFLPFWHMWLTIMQRTSLVILILLIFIIPFLVNKNLNFKTTLLPIILLISALAVGFFVATHFVAKSSMKAQFMASHQHDDDIPGPGLPQNFQFRSRSTFWNRALIQWQENKIFGIGFKEQVPKLNAEETVWIFGGKIEAPNYTYVSGPHNSYITILTRMGLVGLIIFLFVACWWLKSVWSLTKNLNIYNLTLLILPLNGAIHAFFNTGFESPQNCMIMWLFAGGALALAKSQKLTH